MYGFYGKLLSIDLSQKTYRIDNVDDHILTTYLGGKGLASYLLLKENPIGVDPLSPDNRLILAIGATTGSPVWGSCRHGVFTKSPQTGLYSESYAGGSVAEYMAAAGFDAIVIQGASQKPVWLEVCEEVVFFHPAEDLWGLDTYQTEDRVKDWIKENRSSTGKNGVIAIGPAGENQVVFAVIENDYWRSAGRTGVGAVMGSKGIKAMAFRGNQKKVFADPEALNTFAKTLARENRDNPGVQAYKSMGTPMLVDITNKMGCFPTRYWQKGKSSHAEKINAAALHEHCRVKPHACRKCFLSCGRLSTVKAGRRAGLKLEGPEYETIYAFGGLCEVDRIEEIIYLNDICDRMGMDTITAGNLVGLTIEAKRQGRIDYAVDYNQVDGMVRLLEDISARRGIGDTLARGIRFAAEQWRMSDQAVHVKGMEPAGYDPRVLKGMGLAYGTSPRGACHLRATFYKPELSGMIDPDQIQDKARVFVEWEDRLTIFDTFILCRFYRDLYQWDLLAEILKGATGLNLSVEDMRGMAAAILDTTRRFNLREGLVPEDDLLPSRFHSEALPETNSIISEAQMQQLLKDYYHHRGWDENGRIVD